MKISQVRIVKDPVDKSSWVQNFLWKMFLKVLVLMNFEFSKMLFLRIL